MTGKGGRYKERQREQVSYPDCGKELDMGSLVVHCQTQYSMAQGGPGQEVDREGRGNEPRTYKMEFMANAGPRPCPVEGCSGQAAIRTAMQVSFWHRHVQDTVVILEKSNLPHPQYPL